AARAPRPTRPKARASCFPSAPRRKRRRGSDSSSSTPVPCTACASRRPRARSRSVRAAASGRSPATRAGGRSRRAGRVAGGPRAGGVESGWRRAEGGGRLEGAAGEVATFVAPDEPCLARLVVTARQADTACEAEALVTVTDSLLPETKERTANRQGLPGYTLEHAPGKLWRAPPHGGGHPTVATNGHPQSTLPPPRHDPQRRRP